ncbi:DNA polymerase Y family protein [Shewanella sp.]|uniref:Y-family DNA polymerase n=1 Tax=Shewanella sp. TaxID=50422 RepID=UPI00356156FE
MRWLGVWLPNWELDYQRHVQGLASTVPLILYDVIKARVLKACPQAASAGVVAGQSMGSAAQLCPDLQPFPYEASLHQQGCDWLCRHGYSFSARVVPPPAPELHFERCRDVLLLEVGSMSRLFGGEQALGQTLMSTLSRLGCCFAMAFADTPVAAGVLARSCPVFVSECNPLETGALPHSSAHSRFMPRKSLQRFPQAQKMLAAEQLQPSSKNAVKHEVSQMMSCSLSSLPVPELLLERLQGMGLETIGALTQLPRAELGIRFGPEFIQLMGRLDGRLEHPQRFYCPGERYQQRVELMYEAASFDALVFVLGRMFSELSLFLRQRQLAVSMLELVLHYRDCVGVEKNACKAVLPDDKHQDCAHLHLAYPFAEFSAEGLLALCRLQLERFHLVAPVIALTLHKCRFVPRSVLSKATLTDSHRASLSLFARLEARLGADKVRRLEAKPALLPEHSFRLLPISAVIPAADSLQGNASPGMGFACRPPWLLPQPEVVEEGLFTLLRGPERVREPWWQDKSQAQAAARDYYLARHVDGGLCWVFRREGDTGLYLQGWF